MDCDGITSSPHIERRLSPFASRSQISPAISCVNFDGLGMVGSFLMQMHYTGRRLA